MPGKEYGTAHWDSAEKITKKFSNKKKPEEDRLYSEKIRISINTRKTRINNNVLAIGGSGVGKSQFLAKPQLYQANTSFVVTDPKGELLADTGRYLLEKGYIIKVLNMVNMKESDCYNPFAYIREQTDIPVLITNLIANTTPKEAHPGDPFWEKSESMFLQALMYYVWMECPKSEQTMNKVLDLLALAEYDEEGNATELDAMMDLLDDGHPAKVNYNRVMRGAGDTVRSIIISANARLAPFDNPDLRRIFSRDDFEVGTLGTGIGLDGNTKTAVFCVIPDNDTTYNFVVGMLYTQMFKELYLLADHVYHGPLPVHVTFLLDEFANVALPSDFLKLLSTMRSRNISPIIIIQNLAQVKAKYKDEWESIPGNCDVVIYLGGKEPGTHKYISEQLGKQTIWKKSNSQSRGRQGSSSQSQDVLGRELMTPDEVGTLSNDKCIIFVRGRHPVLDNKYPTFITDEYKHAESLGTYIHTPLPLRDGNVTILSDAQISEYEAAARKHPEQYKITTMTIEEMIAAINAATHAIKQKETEQAEILRFNKYDNLFELLADAVLTDSETEVLQEAVQKGLTDDQILVVLKHIKESKVYIESYARTNAVLGI
ncbi:MAG: type IV secretory system conjugative DNA transfer family protein [Clostridium sp.]|nr:type IV secretory system conjugative DNA transfer family protein [Clostridium sp.]